MNNGNDNPQKSLMYTILHNDDCIELIKHQDLHLWVYFNGVKMDVIFPRHEKFYQQMEFFDIYKKLSYGKSLYNKNKIESFCIELMPELFL